MTTDAARTPARHKMSPMRVVTLVIVGVTLLALALASLVTYSGFGRFLFAQGSDSGYVVLRARAWVVFLVWAGASIAVLAAWRFASTRTLFLVFPASCAVWLVSGRAVGISWDSRVVAGYFFVRTAEFQVVVAEERPLLSVTRVHGAIGPAGFVDLRSAERHQRLFIGPLCADSIATYLQLEGAGLPNDGGRDPLAVCGADQ